jgi:hypothetical protein
LGRERGYYGVELTAFVEQAYKSGLAKFAIEAGMAAGPRQSNDSAECVTHLNGAKIQAATTPTPRPSVLAIWKSG